MIIRIRPKLTPELKRIFDKLLSNTDKTIPNHYKFFKAMPVEMRDEFMNYFSFLSQYDLKEYELNKRRYKNNEKVMLDTIMSIITDYKDSEIWKNDHLKLVRGIHLGSMYQIKYKNYQHDPFPLAIFLNTYDATHQNFQAINLHYFLPTYREYFVDRILKINQPRLARGQEPILTLPLVENLIPRLGLAYRNYKAEEIKVIEKISCHRWKTYLKIDHRKVTLD